MFPYCSVVFFIATVVGIGMTLKLFFVWKSGKNENIGYFFRAMAIATVYFFLSALPGTAVKDPTLAAVVYILAWIPLFMALFYFTRLALHFWGMERMKNIFLGAILFLVVFTTIFNFVYFSPTEIKEYKNFSVCFERSPSWVLKLSGIAASLLLLINSVLFLRGGVMSREKNIKIRGLMIGGGLLSVALSVFLKYVAASYWQETRVFIFYSAPLFLFGILVIYFGIQYKRKISDQ